MNGPRPTLRPRYRLRTLLVLPIAAAGACLFVAGINPFQVDPDLAALNELEAWVSQRENAFTSRPMKMDWSAKPEPFARPDGPMPNLCLVKGAWITGHVDFPARPGYFSRPVGGPRYTQRFAVGVEGFSEVCFDGPLSAGCGGGGMTPGELARVHAILAAMPPALRGHTPAETMLVGFADPKGRWTTVRYERRRSPPEIDELVGIAADASARWSQNR